MNDKISNRDLEALSAYLDGQLAADERTRLESRLKHDSELQNELKELTQVRQLVRSLPKVRAPRNFTLSPQISAVKSKPPRAYPVLRLASALATFLLALVLISDFWGDRLIIPSPVIEGLSAEVMDQTQVSIAAEATDAVAELEASEEIHVEPLEKAAEAAPADEQTPEATMEAAQLGVPGRTEEPPSAMLAVEEQPATVDEETAEMEPEITLTPPTVEEPIAAEPDLTSITATGSKSENEIRLLSFRILEVVLALIALSTGIAALYFRRGTGG